MLDGGEGNDQLDGGAGNDTYVFGRGYGHDTVSNYDVAAGKRDMVRLAGLNAEDVEFGTIGSGTYTDMIIRIKETGETLTIQRGMSHDSRYWIDAVEFADGTVWEHDQYMANLSGTEAGEIL